ncbi:hypothetical protein [Anaeromyxobacter sp. SG17]|uniref:hypothetical protein n=1 Tax=Anaeromyxobacter sp. SG17 TaxID=2925405 RepID=UPI001F58B51B|nr:hypothetical protein [Anaeromyxobacter sp. SG17]
MTQVDLLLRSEIHAYVPTFRAPSSEPIWTEWGDTTPTGVQLVLYGTHRKDHFGSLGAFWVHALFNFLEDRFEDDAVDALASASLCRESTPSEVVQTIQSRVGRPLEHQERVAMLLEERPPAPRVFTMLESERYWATLIDAARTCAAVFLAEPAWRP